MPSIGELFIQLGVLGNANELKKANQEFQKSNILKEKQAKLDKARAEALEKIQKAQTKQEKRDAVKQYKEKKANIEKETNLKLQLAENKALKGNIAQWATYAHAVSMASAIVISSLKKIYDEVDKVTSYGQNMMNIGMTTSTSIPELQKYGRVAHALNSSVSEESVMQQMAKLNQAYDFYKAGNPSKLMSMLNGGELAQLGASGFYKDVITRKVPNATSFLEGLRQAIQGKSPERQANIIQASGLDQSLLPMLRMSTEEFQKYASELQRDALSEKQLEEQAKTRARLNVFQQHFQDFELRVFSKFTPYVEKIMKVVDDHLPSILSFTEDTFNKASELFDHLAETLQREEIKAYFELAKQLWDKLAPVLVKALQGWEMLILLMGKLIGDKLGQDKLDEEALNKEFYDPKTNKYYPGKAGGSWGTDWKVGFDNFMLNMMDKIAPESAIPESVRQARLEYAFQNAMRNRAVNNMYSNDNSMVIEQFNFNTPNQINNPNDFKIGLDFAINRLNTGQN